MTTAKPDNKTCVDRPLVGVRIRTVNGGGYQKIYEGGVWHSPSQLNANVSTNMYTCANEGCPDDGTCNWPCTSWRWRFFGICLAAVTDIIGFPQLRDRLYFLNISLLHLDMTRQQASQFCTGAMDVLCGSEFQ